MKVEEVLLFCEMVWGRNAIPLCLRDLDSPQPPRATSNDDYEEFDNDHFPTPENNPPDVKENKE